MKLSLLTSGALTRGYCVLVPMYNEEANVEHCIRRIASVLAQTQPAGQFIVVDDGSRDSTAQILNRLLLEERNLAVVTHRKNEGYGTALVTGIRAAAERSFGYVLFMDADLTTDPKYIPDFVEQMRADVDVIKATRYSAGGGMRGVPLHRVLISRLGNRVSRFLFRLPITDLTNGFRAVKTALLVDIPFREGGFAIIMEELYHLSATAASYAEVPYVLTSRGAHQGASRFVYRPKVFLQYFKYALLSARRTAFGANPMRWRDDERSKKHRDGRRVQDVDRLPPLQGR